MKTIQNVNELPADRYMSMFYSGDGKPESALAAFELAYGYKPADVIGDGHRYIFCVHPAGVHPARVGKDQLAAKIR